MLFTCSLPTSEMFTHRASSGDRRGPLKHNDFAANLEQRMCAGCASYAATYNNYSHDGRPLHKTLAAKDHFRCAQV